MVYSPHIRRQNNAFEFPPTLHDDDGVTTGRRPFCPFPNEHIYKENKNSPRLGRQRRGPVVGTACMPRHMYNFRGAGRALLYGREDRGNDGQEWVANLASLCGKGEKNYIRNRIRCILGGNDGCMMWAWRQLGPPLRLRPRLGPSGRWDRTSRSCGSSLSMSA